MCRFFLFGFIACLTASMLPAKQPEVIPVRLVRFDSGLRKIGRVEAQMVVLEIVDGRKAGQTLSVLILPSQHTGRFVGEKLYLRLPLSRVRSKKTVFFAGELLDREPAAVAPDGFTVTAPFKAGAADRYIAGRIAVDGLNEINGVASLPGDPAGWLPAEQAIAIAAKAAPDGVQGAFVFAVRAADRADGMIWLNSEPEYWNPRSLNVAIPPQVAADFKLRYGAEPDVLLKGRKIVISGIALRVKIQKKNPDDFYHQTQVRVWSAHQIKIVE